MRPKSNIHRKFGFLIGCIFVWAFTDASRAQVTTDREASQHVTRWWKGNLHTHSLWSDGNDFPEMIAKWYRDHEYHFLALTDHNILSIGEQWMDEQKIIARAGGTAIPKYVEAWGEDWVETRELSAPGKAKSNGKNGLSEDPPPITEAMRKQIRLRPLAEFRSKLEQPGRFLLLQAEEISDRAEKVPVHLNATNLNSLIQPVGGETVLEAINNNLRVAEEQAQQTGQPILVHLNHPNFGWAVTAEELAAATNGRFLEIYNGHPGVNHLGDEIRPGVERLWDIANTIRIGDLDVARILGLATDDSHRYHARSGATPGRGWIMVRSHELDAASLIEAMRNGDFYCSSGVTLSRCEFDSSRRVLSLAIEAQPEVHYQTQFIGTRKDYDHQSTPRLNAEGKPIRATRVYSRDIGQILATDDSLTPTYQLTGDELYVRAVVTSSEQHPNASFEEQMQQAWTQPIGWNK